MHKLDDFVREAEQRAAELQAAVIPDDDGENTHLLNLEQRRRNGGNAILHLVEEDA